MPEPARGGFGTRDRSSPRATCGGTDSPAISSRISSAGVSAGLLATGRRLDAVSRLRFVVALLPCPDGERHQPQQRRSVLRADPEVCKRIGGACSGCRFGRDSRPLLARPLALCFGRLDSSLLAFGCESLLFPAQPPLRPRGAVVPAPLPLRPRAGPARVLPPPRPRFAVARGVPRLRLPAAAAHVPPRLQLRAAGVLSPPRPRPRCAAARVSRLPRPRGAGVLRAPRPPQRAARARARPLPPPASLAPALPPRLLRAAAARVRRPLRLRGAGVHVPSLPRLRAATAP